MTEYLLLLVVGRLLIFLAMKFPLLAESRFEFVRRLFTCSLCCGVWIYAGLSWGFGTYLLSDVFPYIPVLSEIVTGAVSSFLVFLLVLGWKSYFEVIVVE